MVVYQNADFIHVMEYLWQAAYSFYAEGSADAATWVRTYAFWILKDHAAAVATALVHVADERKIKGEKRKAIDRCARYLQNQQEYLHYDQYLARGLPIATGVIEGDCRYLVKDRIDVTGARWSLKGAESVLILRSLVTNGDFHEY